MRSLELIYNLKNKIEAIMLDLEDEFCEKFNQLEYYRYTNKRYFFKKRRMARLEKSMILIKQELSAWGQINENMTIVSVMIAEENDIIAALETLHETKDKIASSIPLGRVFGTMSDVHHIIECFMQKPEISKARQLIVADMGNDALKRRDNDV